MIVRQFSVVLLGLSVWAGCGTSSSGGASGGAGNGGVATDGGAPSGGKATSSGGLSSGGAAGSAGSASGGASAGGGSAGNANAGAAAERPADVPPGNAKEDLSAFVGGAKYREAPWISETDAPREGIVGSQHLSKVRVFMNPTLVTSMRAGRDGRMGRPYPDLWSMAVKELYDPDTDALVGVASMFKTAEGSGAASWLYFCYGPDPRCLAGYTPSLDAPIFNNGAGGLGQSCSICHGNSVFTKPPP